MKVSWNGSCWAWMAYFWNESERELVKEFRELALLVAGHRDWIGYGFTVFLVAVGVGAVIADIRGREENHD